MICPLKFNSNTVDTEGDRQAKVACWCDGNECKWFPVCDKLLELVDAILYPKLRIDKGGK